MSSETILKVQCLESTNSYGRFMAEPLERGEGITMGNALRRVLLNSLSGAAVTWVMIDGVQHEFSSIPHMKEDTIDFLLNVKGLRLRPVTGRPGKMTLKAQGEGRVTAADIAPSADFEIVNSELALATLDSPEAKLNVEFNVELGKGFAPAGNVEGQPIGIIPVDAIFSPVRRVNYSKEPVHIGQADSYERLYMEVWTDGTISPIEAVAKSSQILLSRISLFAELTRPGEVAEPKPALRVALPPEQHDLPLEKLEFSVRTYNCLKRGGIHTLGQLLEKSEEELMNLRHFGEKSRQEVQEKLQGMGHVLPIKESAARAEAKAEKADEAPAEEKARK